MKIVILGGSGFLGQHLTARLCADQHEIVTVSRSPIRSLAKNHSHADITLDDQQELRRLLIGANFLFHFASDSTPGSSRLQPSLEGLNNILPTLRMLEQLQGNTTTRLVYISSGGAIYDSNQDTSKGFTEDAVTNPMSYYGAGKLAIEEFIRAYSQQTGNGATIIRPANIYGPGQLAKKQFGIIPTLFNAITNGETFTIWGDGSAVRDYLYIDDFIDLCQRLLLPDINGDSLGLFNVGSGQGHSILDLYHSVEKVTGLELQIDFQPGRGVDVPTVVLDCSRAAQKLWWSAHTTLEAGLSETWKWYKNHVS
jgi:UDP-glucose 4-epimerase